MRQIVDGYRFCLGIAVAASLLAAATGCHDQVPAERWSLEAGSSASTDAGGLADTGVDDPPPDTVAGGQIEDTGSATDTGGDSGRADTGRIDTGGEFVERGGWYVSGIEQSEFIPQEDVHPRGRFDNGTCSIRIRNPRLERERWWAIWQRPSVPNRMDLHPPDQEGAPQRFFGYYEATGTLSPEGEYGYRGQYDRQFDIREAEVDVCRSVSQLGHCVVPRPGTPNCVVMNREALRGAARERLKKQKFVRRALDAVGVDTSSLV
ncbi:MAG: hypothetical protein ABEN55_15025, partial [Bradymonadaceae bacterium]